MADHYNDQFQCLKMQQDFLRKGRLIKQLEKDIDETPTGLDRPYGRNWERIMAQRDINRTRALSLLRWAAFVLRPLTVSEISEAMLVNDDCEDLPVDEILGLGRIDNDYIESVIVGLCGSLIEVRSSLLESSVGSRKIHLAHFSIKQYLLCKITPRGAAMLVNESLRASNEVTEGIALAKLCLCYIGFRRVWGSSLPAENDRIGMAFRDYAATYWHQHVDGDKVGDEELVEAMNAFFDGHIQTWESWRDWYDTNGDDLQLKETETVIPASRLYYASRLGLTAVVRFLLQHCQHNPDEMLETGRTALEVACEKGNLEIAKTLLEAGADVNVAGHRGRTPLYGASMNGHLQVVKLILERQGSFEIKDIRGLTPLHAASSNGHLEVVKLLLDKGADITVANENGWTLLISASSQGHLEVVKLLLDMGADTTVANETGVTPLHLASINGHPDVVKLLLDKGADFTIANKDGLTPLLIALSKGHLEITKLLLHRGTDITVANKNGVTPLHIASRKGHRGTQATPR